MSWYLGIVLMVYAIFVTVLLVIVNEWLHKKHVENEHLRKTIGENYAKKYSK